ncbi:MAG TPA: 7-cyano-7-deazaguanine synthase QueC [Phycisphaerae bacterium]|mgnify:CR=1 FL=1|nr:7-cyano-7-deazaguanine synthase QueC [Phycisphaerae bacterium]HRW52717.1 7-cyano-7-deazaguanine synthase QueC [Phycisphaerae bacterium]
MNVVLLHSGGLDSTTLLYHLRDQGDVVRCLAVDYGQRHARELAAATSICEAIGVEQRSVDLGSITPLLAGSALTDDTPVPQTPYDRESMKATVVPNRNMILISIATAWAVSLKYDAVAYAAHGGDHEIYPDCRPAFAEAMDRAMGLCDWRPVRLRPAFVGKSKADLVRLGAALGVPFERTWSCYVGGDAHCGRCGTCVERREAFRIAGVEDPTVYDAPGA